MQDTVPASGYRPDIQGLRAVAVLSVLGYHVGLPGWGGGYLGVDVFFVISGYLIGGRIVRELRETGRLNFARFYSRRARRILPASLAVIVATVIAALYLAPPLRAPEIVVDAIWASLSGANIRFAIQGTDYLHGVTPSPLQHYWSLSVEEQFYVLAPVLLLGLFVVFRGRLKAVAAAGLLVTAASFAMCALWGVSSPWSYFTIPARAWELGVGILAAVLAAQMSRVSASWRQLTAVGGALCLVAGAWLANDSTFPHPGIGTLLPVFGTAAIILAGERSHASTPIVNRTLGIRPAQFLGAVSFSLYLVHWPVLALAQENSNSDQPLPLWVRVLLAVLSLPLAWLLWRFIERPFLRTRTTPTPARRSLVAAAAATGVLVLSLGVAMPALAARPFASERVAASRVEMLPAGTSYVPSNLHPKLGTAVIDTGALYTDGCQQGTSGSALKVCSFGASDGPTVVLFGDSHAGRWFPALEAAFAGRPIRLVTLTKSGCRSLESPELWAGAENRSCAHWRASAVDWLEAHPPQLLVFADHLGRSNSSPTATQTRWENATATTLARLPLGVPVAVIAETPEFDFNPPACLSRHLNDARACSEAREIAVNAPVIDGVRAGAARSGATVVDMTDWFCNPSMCPTIIGSTLVYTDEHHLSGTFSAQLGAAVYAKLGPLIGTADSAAAP